MKIHRSCILLLMAIVAALGPHSAGQAADWQQIPISSLPAFHPQEPKRFELPNGMVVFLQEDHELPLIAVPHGYVAAPGRNRLTKSG